MAIDFTTTGKSSFVNIPTTTGILQNVAESTLMCWVNVRSVPATERTLLCVENGTNTGARASIVARSDTLSWRVTCRRLDADGLNTLDATGPSGNYVIGSWVHLAAVFRYTTPSSNNIQLYINGVLNNTQVQGAWNANTSNTAPAGVGIAGRTANTTTYFDGIITDVRIYHRALATAELANLVVARGRDRLVNGLVHLWRCNDLAPGSAVTTNIVQDVVGNTPGTPTITSGTAPIYAENVMAERASRRTAGRR